MSTNMILYAAIGVFTLMIVGIYLTSLEFKRLSEKSATRKHTRPNKGPASINRGADVSDTA